MFKRKTLPVLTAAALFFAIPGAQKAHACPDANGILTHCANFQVIVGIVNFITANVHRPPGAPTFGAFGNTPEVLLKHVGFFNLLYFSALMNAFLAPLPSSTAGSSGNELDLSDNNIQDGAFGRPLCGASGDCGAGPLGELFGGGPNSGYSCDSAGPGCGTDLYNPEIGDGFRNYGGNIATTPVFYAYSQLPADGQSANASPLGADPAGFRAFIANHRFQQNLTSGAMDPFGGGTDDSYVNPRTGETVIFDPANPPPEVDKARKLVEAYVNDEINYPFFDDAWETRPISDFDPNQGNRGGVRPLGPSISSQLQGGLFPGATTGGTGGSAHSTTAPGAPQNEVPALQARTPTLPTGFDQSLRELFSEYGLELDIRLDGSVRTRTAVVVPPGQDAPSSDAVRPISSLANDIRQRSVLLDTKPMLFSGTAYDVEIVQDKDGKLMALGTGENAGHVFGEVRKGSSLLGGYRREGPWQAPAAASAERTPSTGTQTSSAGEGRSGGSDPNCDNCEFKVPPVRLEGGRFYFQVNSNIAQSDRADMANLFTDGFESGNTVQWSVIAPP